jgi:hypothetical protein
MHSIGTYYVYGCSRVATRHRGRHIRFIKVTFSFRMLSGLGVNKSFTVGSDGHLHISISCSCIQYVHNMCMDALL